MEFSAEEVRFLVDEKIREAVAALAARNLDEWGLSRELLKTDLPPERRRVVAEAVRLFPKIRKKFQTDAFLAADALALMQASGADVGRRKAAILAGKGERVLDVCCGMGGDSIHLPPEVRVEGIDLSEARLEMFRFNHARMRGGAEIRREDAEGIDASGALVLIDPDRRDPDDKSRNWNPENLSPSPGATLRVASGSAGALVKLPPGADAALFESREDELGGVETEFLGRRRECCELLVRTGRLADSPGTVRAVHVDSGLVRQATREEVAEARADAETGPAEGFLCEPSPALLRSGVDRVEARRLGLRLADRDVSWFFSPEPVRDPFWDCFPLLASSPLSAGKMKRMLDERGIGIPVVKKRGLKTDVERELSKIGRRREGAPGTLLLTRLGGEAVAFLAGPALTPAEAEDVR